MGYAKLLDRVEPDACDGFGFKGRLLRPGDRIELPADLENVVILERTEVEGPLGARNRRRWEALYILWRYDRKTGEWTELAKVQSTSSDWAVLLREAARFALGKMSWAIAPKMAEVADRIRIALDKELQGLDPSQRRQLVAQLHDEFAVRIVAGAA